MAIGAAMSRAMNDGPERAEDQRPHVHPEGLALEDVVVAGVELERREALDEEEGGDEREDDEDDDPRPERGAGEDPVSESLLRLDRCGAALWPVPVWAPARSCS